MVVRLSFSMDERIVRSRITQFTVLALLAVVIGSVIAWRALTEEQAPTPAARAVERAGSTRTGNVPRASTRDPELPLSDVESRWLDSLETAEDLHGFIESASGAALAGDAAAQTAILRALFSCSNAYSIVGVARKYSTAEGVGIPDDLVREAIETHQKCAKIYAKTPIEAQNHASGTDQLEIPYWTEIADKSGTTYGIVLKMLSQAGNIQSTTTIEQISQIEGRLQNIVRAAQPEFAAIVGATLGFSRRKDIDNEVRAAAWMIYGCRAADCLDLSLPPIWTPCPPLQGAGCDPELSLTNSIREALGPIRFSQAEVLSRDIESSIQRRAWSELDLQM